MNGKLFFVAILTVVVGASYVFGAETSGTIFMTGPDVPFLKLDGSNVMAGNLNLSTYYIYGQPMDGSIGSGVIWASTFDGEANVNISVTAESLNLTYPDMLIRLVSTANTVHFCSIASTNITVNDDSHDVYYVNSSCVVQNVSMSSYIETTLSPGGISDLFTVYAADGSIEVAKGATLKNKEMIKARKEHLYTDHLRVVSGMIVGTNSFPGIYQDSGKYLYIRSVVDASSQNSSTNGMHFVYNSSGVWIHNNVTGLNMSYCDDGTGTSPCSTNQFRRHYIYTIGFDSTYNGDTTRLHQIAATDSEAFVNLGDCLNTEVTPLSFNPPDINRYVAVLTYAYCGKRDDSAWADGFIDLRLAAGTFGAVPDTSIFLTVDGSRPLTSNWNAGQYNITADWFLGSVVNVTDGLVCTDCIALTSETSGDYVDSISGTNPINVADGSGEASTPTVSLNYNTTYFELDSNNYLALTEPYRTGTAFADEFVNVTGDTMTGTLNVTSGNVTIDSGNKVCLTQACDHYIYYNGTATIIT